MNVQFFDQEHGLWDRTVNCITQDDRGLIWIGTGNGLNRYNGTHFQTVGGANNPLAYSSIIGIKKDQQGYLWIQKRTGEVIRFDPTSEEILDLPMSDTSLVNEEIEIIDPECPKSPIYFRNNQGRIFYLDDQGNIKPFGQLSFLESTSAKPTPWKTLVVYDWTIGRRKFEPKEIDSSGKVVRKMAEINYNTNFWEKGGISPRFMSFPSVLNKKFLHEIFYYIEPKGELQPITFSREGQAMKFEDLGVRHRPSHFIHAAKDSRGYRWIVVGGQVFLFDSNGEFIKEVTEQLRNFTDYNWSVNQIFLDNYDQLWVSTGLGIFLLKAQENPFHNYLDEPGNISCRGIMEMGQDYLFIATYQGAKVLNKHTEAVLTEHKNRFVSISKGVGDSIWLGRHGPQYGLFKTDDLSFELFSLNIDHKRRNCHGVFVDPFTQHLYLSTYDGLYLRNQDGSLKKIEKTNGFKKIHQSSLIHFYPKKNEIWITSEHGLFKMDRLRGIVNHFDFPNNYIKHLHEDDSGIFWLATAGGLIKWDREQNSIRQYTTKDGLSHNVLYAVYEDRKGFLWLPSNNGLMQFDKESEDVVVYLPEDGIPHKEFNTYSHYQAQDGRLYFGGLNGVTAFYPEQVAPEINNAPFIITDYQRFDADKGQLVNKTKELLEHREIVLKPSDKFFNLSFSLLDYSARNKRYAWKLENLDADWNYQTESSVRINALQYGNYVLRIKAKGSGGQWALKELSIPIRVLKPAYLQTKFIVLFILLAGLLIWSIVWYRTAQLRRRALLLSQEVDQRTETIRTQNAELAKANQFKDKILALVAHDLRAPLITMSGLTRKISFLIQKNRIDDIAKLSTTIDNSALGVTNLLDTIMSWALIQKGQFNIEPELLDVNAEVREVINLYKDTAQAKAIEINYSAMRNFRVFADRNAFQTILRNLLNNAIKFSYINGIVEIRCHRRNSQNVIEVKDYGIGIAPGRLDDIFNVNRKNRVKGTNGELGSGLGLALCKELVKLNKGRLEVESELNKGTSFYIVLPADR